MLAKAVAGEAGVTFFSISGSDFVNVCQVGVVVFALFLGCQKSSTAIIFIDEIDAVGRQRGLCSAGNDRREQTDQLLIEMDGLRNEGIIVIATDRSDVLDPALLRPRRSDSNVFSYTVPQYWKVVKQSWKFTLRTNLYEDVDLKVVAPTNSRLLLVLILKNVLNEAALVLLVTTNR